MALLATPELGAATGAGVTPDAVVGRLDGMLAELAEFVVQARGGEIAPDAARVDRISRLEQLRSAVAAAQAAESVQFARSQVADQVAHGVHPAEIGRGIADQLGLACRIAPTLASRRLTVARAWWFDLPQTFEAVTLGKLSEQVGEIVARETRHLDAPTRRSVDAQLATDRLSRLGVRAAEAKVRERAYRADPTGYVQRGRTERTNRCVTVRPAPDTMSYLTGFLPVEQGVACFASLNQAADVIVGIGDPRTRGQIVADLMVERLTGQARAVDVPLEVNLVIPLASLIDPADPTPAVIPGYGPVPGGIARSILADSGGRTWWRRLFTRPTTTVPGRGLLVAGDPVRRRFDGWLGQLISLRDQTCRDPFCDAPIRHLDHIARHVDGGTTTLDNGRGVCARGNYVREMPGWQVDLIHTGLDGYPHTTRIVTPTGHSYLSRAPDPP